MLRIIYAILFTFILLMQYIPIQEINSIFSGNQVNMVEELNENNTSNIPLQEIKAPKYIHDGLDWLYGYLSIAIIEKKFWIVNENLRVDPYEQDFIKPPNFIN